jgi:hypothetical protein
MQGRRTLDKAWRGTRIPTKSAGRSLRDHPHHEPDTGWPAAVELRPFGRRRTGVVIRRNDDQTDI